jgi:hypothetical protein
LGQAGSIVLGSNGLVFSIPPGFEILVFVCTRGLRVKAGTSICKSVPRVKMMSFDLQMDDLSLRKRLERPMGASKRQFATFMVLVRKGCLLFSTLARRILHQRFVIQ